MNDNSIFDKVNNWKTEVLERKLTSFPTPHLNCRFPSLLREVQGNVETYWFNDGTPDGARIVSFEVKFNGPSLMLYHW